MSTPTIDPSIEDRSPQIQVIREPLTYEQHQEHLTPAKRTSYFKDLLLARNGDQAAKGRLAQHNKEMRAQPRQERHLAGAVYEWRATPSRIAGQGGEFAPPLWLNEMFATARRAGKVLQDVVPTFDLPPGVSSVSFPRIINGSVAAIVQEGNAVPSNGVTTTPVSSPAAPFAGLSDWPIQALEQSPAGAHLDWAIFTDLTESLDTSVEEELIAGTGTGNGFYGLLNLPGINQVTYTEESPTAKAMFPSFGKMVAAISKNRKRPPELWLVTTSRIGWIASSEDAQERPLMISDKDEPGEFDLLLWPGKVDDAIPVTLDGDQDAIIACRPSDMFLLASDLKSTIMPNVMMDVTSGTLQVRFELRRYVAALLGRYPSGISTLRGTGMAVQEGF